MEKINNITTDYDRSCGCSVYKVNGIEIVTTGNSTCIAYSYPNTDEGKQAMIILDNHLKQRGKLN